MALATLQQVKDYLGFGDIPAATLMTRYGHDAQFITVKNTVVRIKESGQGEPLLLLHGFSASADTWDGWRAELSDKYRVIAIDVPPFAITGPLPQGKTTTDAVVHFINDVANHLGLTRFYLAGNSLGGFLAWNYALHYPTKVKKLILVDSVGYYHRAPLPVILYRTKGLRHLVNKVAPRLFIEQNIRSVYGDASRVNPDSIQRYQDLLRRDGTRAAIADIMRGIYVDSTAVKQIRTPTLILWGAKDRWIPPAHGRRFQQDIPNSTLISYDDLGHIPMEEDPQRTAADVRHFLQDDRYSTFV